ncbi:S41 family peptidase [Marinifilum caeruleilacunae]|uniref:Tail specific protease domain-containing protein n=1 Tax=Marinifilum caeruleilacunae TaxID=2499076 RepID=A0ABX1WXU6_9BACT|nr:S41 family peptidase [Marinifilum caeruleilacunae]NOU60944.1 hypothetical protein [Marinifilum caeruleilacunae]
MVIICTFQIYGHPIAMNKRIVLLLIALLLIGSYFYLGRSKGKPVESFEAFHKVFSEKYALFDVKQIDWDAEYQHYSKLVNEHTSDDELFAIFQEMLQKLDDKHCYIYRFNEIYFSGFGLPSLNYYDLLSFDFRLPRNGFSLDVIEDEYLLESEKSLQVYSFLPPMGIRKVFTTGWLQDSIAYIHMSEMSNRSEEVHESIQHFLKKYQTAKGYVIDVRDNIGGYSMPSKELAAHFSQEEHTYAISRLRNPENTAKFKAAEPWILYPARESTYQNQPIALLTNRNTQSAAELFCLMMMTLPRVKQIGDTTSGIFADTHIGKLPNGWEYRLSVRKTNNAHDAVVEDIGLVPDILIQNDYQELQAGRDLVLDWVIEDMIINNN